MSLTRLDLKPKKTIPVDPWKSDLFKRKSSLHTSSSTFVIPSQTFSQTSAQVAFLRTTDKKVISGELTFFQGTAGATTITGQFNSGMESENVYTFVIKNGTCINPKDTIYDLNTSIQPYLSFNNGGIPAFQFIKSDLHITDANGIANKPFIVTVNDEVNVCGIISKK
ncbi:hypothetical protein G9A89_009840 [Geosiphon pyriformis]|nr:hypothetical protein G9A89_009840 [Geosiphon pyriformis]